MKKKQAVLEYDVKVVKNLKLSDSCLACGLDRKFIEKERINCTVWGTTYNKHIYK